MNPHAARIAVLRARITIHHPVAGRLGVGHQTEKCSLRHVHPAEKAHKFRSDPQRADLYTVGTVSLDNQRDSKN